MVPFNLVDEGYDEECLDKEFDNEDECLGLVDLQYIVIDSTRVIAHDHLVHGHHGIWNVLEVISLETKAWDSIEEEPITYQEQEAKKVEHERELELIRERANLLNLDKKGASSKSHDTPRHRFPNFNDKTDDLDAFFQAFEYQAKLLNIDQSSELKSYLLSSLSGKARDIFNSLPFETDYKATKKVLLNKFNFTPNFYRRKFFNTCPFKEENVSCYIHRLSMYFDRWISLSETAQDFNSLSKPL